MWASVPPSSSQWLHETSPVMSKMCGGIDSNTLNSCSVQYVTYATFSSALFSGLH